MSLASIFTVPGADGRRCHEHLQPGLPLIGTGNVDVGTVPEAIEVPFDGVVILAAFAECRVRVSNDPTDLATADSYRFDSFFGDWFHLPVRAGQTISFRAATTGTISAFMAARLQDVNNFTA